MEKLSSEKRTEILVAAMKLFSEKGFERTTVDEIAAQANVGKGTIYLYFENKERIFIAIIEDGLAEFYRLIEESINSANNYMQGIYNIINVQLQFIENHKDFYQIFIKERFSLNLGEYKKPSDYIKEVHQKLQQMTTNYLQKCIDSGLLRQLDPKELYWALSGITAHFAFNWLMESQSGSLLEKSNIIKEIFLYGAGNQIVSSDEK